MFQTISIQTKSSPEGLTHREVGQLQWVQKKAPEGRQEAPEGAKGRVDGFQEQVEEQLNTALLALSETAGALEGKDFKYAGELLKTAHQALLEGMSLVEKLSEAVDS